MVTSDHDARRREFEDVFRAHYRAVQAYVVSRYPESDPAAIMSTTFEIAWRRFDDVPAEAARGWLIGVARNCARNERRADLRRRRHTDALASTPAPVGVDGGQITPATVAALRDAWGRLGTRDREVLLLAEWDDLQGADLAAALGITKNAAAVRLHRARQRLRDAFAGEVAP